MISANKKKKRIEVKFIGITEDPAIREWLETLSAREKLLLWYAQLRSLDYKIESRPLRFDLAKRIADKYCNPCPSHYECCHMCLMPRPCPQELKPNYCKLYFCPVVYEKLTDVTRVFLYGKKWKLEIDKDFAKRKGEFG